VVPMSSVPSTTTSCCKSQSIGQFTLGKSTANDPVVSHLAAVVSAVFLRVSLHETGYQPDQDQLAETERFRCEEKRSC
jgi:hypothetical protein